jgi:S1-C subfamily serine protease
VGYEIYADGARYAGEHKGNKRHGNGRATYPGGNTYVGEWQDDKRNGQGTESFAYGDTYVGEWLDDKSNGQGTYTSADGTIKEGIWENDVFKYANTAEPPVVSETKPQDNEIREAASGSGFAVSSDGYVITNNHVIEGCQEVAVYDGGIAVPVTVITYDLQNDLALLKGDFTPQNVFALSGDQPELLQDIYVAGYPFGNEVSSSIKVTKGIISSLAGIGNNFSNVQIDAALQVGNSGGPILDEMGNVVGVAVSKLDAKYMYDNFGSIPENTNFGIRSSVVRNILDSNGVSSPSPNRSEITRSELGAMITGGTYYVSCMMTLAQIELLITEKVMFENLR